MKWKIYSYLVWNGSYSEFVTVIWKIDAINIHFALKVISKRPETWREKYQSLFLQLWNISEYNDIYIPFRKNVLVIN